jgi:hypothetical protein
MPRPPGHDKITIISMAVIASALATLLHEGVGHGLTAWARGDVPTELTSNHLSSMYPDHLVQAAGTLVNLIIGVAASLISRSSGTQANRRYFFWILAALNLLPGAGYFLFSGIIGFGDWNEVIRDLPYHAAWRVGMTIGGGVLYVLFVRLLASSDACRITRPARSLAWPVCWIRSASSCCSFRRFPPRSADHRA